MVNATVVDFQKWAFHPAVVVLRRIQFLQWLTSTDFGPTTMDSFFIPFSPLTTHSNMGLNKRRVQSEPYQDQIHGLQCISLLFYHRKCGMLSLRLSLLAFQIIPGGYLETGTNQF